MIYVGDDNGTLWDHITVIYIFFRRRVR
jgi:hypothetical protein